MELSTEQKNLLHKLYYDEKFFFGREKLHQYVMKNYPEMKISRRMTQAWLSDQTIYQKTKPVPPKQRISAIAINKSGYFQIDLARPLPRDNGYNYYFGVADVATRKLFTRPLKEKTAISVAEAFKDIIDKNNLHVSLCRSDHGNEFFGEFSEFLMERGIKQIYSTKASPWENGLIERFNGTIKRALFKNELHTGKKDWVEALAIITDNINETWNRSLKTTANEAGDLPEAIRIDRLQNYGNMKKHRRVKTSLKTGDLVRLKIRYPQGYGYTKNKQTYSNTIYIVVNVIPSTISRQVTYKISEGVKELKHSYSIIDLLKIKDRVEGEINPGDIEQEEEIELVDENAVGSRSIQDQREVDDLLKNTDEVRKVRETRRPKPIDNDNTYVIEKILKRRKFGKRWKYLVLYEGFPISDATWEFGKDIQAPDLMKDFLSSIKKK